MLESVPSLLEVIGESLFEMHSDHCYVLMEVYSSMKISRVRILVKRILSAIAIENVSVMRARILSCAYPAISWIDDREYDFSAV